MRTPAWIFAACLFSANTAAAKDDSPNPTKLAGDHPWHPLEPSITAIEVACGKDVHRYELRVDDRGWLYLIGPSFEAVEMPGQRFLKSGTWKKIDLAEWLAARDGELSLRELSR